MIFKPCLSGVAITTSSLSSSFVSKTNINNNDSAVPPTLVLLSGFPDRASSWSRVTAHFEKTHHIVSLSLPDFEEPELGRFWGYPVADIVAGIATVIEPHHKRGSAVHLVGHDWGSFYVQSYARQFPHTLRRLVLLDVGQDTFNNPDRRQETVVKVLYMAWLALCFVASRISDMLGTILIVLYPWSIVGPCPYETDVPWTGKTTKSFMCYPYLQFFLWMFRSPEEQATKNLITENHSSSAPPTLFMFGKKKRVMYHSDSYLKRLQHRNDGSRSKCFDNDGHYLHWTSPNEVAEEMKTFFAEELSAE